MNARFFVPGSYVTGDTIELPRDEAAHLTRVLRLKAGDVVRVFDGRGHEFAASIVETTKDRARLVVSAAADAAPEPRIAITVAQAVLKGDKMDDVVRDAVMVGATMIQPIVTTRTEVTLPALAKAHRPARWARVAASSAKQCGRAVVPTVCEPIALAALVDLLKRLVLPEPALMLVEPGAAHEVAPLGELDGPAPTQATIVIGPEGGWTPEEVELGASACRLVGLGGRTIRADAMAVVATAALFTRWGEY